jgi:hypothetical protein
MTTSAANEHIVLKRTVFVKSQISILFMCRTVCTPKAIPMLKPNQTKIKRNINNSLQGYGKQETL